MNNLNMIENDLVNFKDVPMIEIESNSSIEDRYISIFKYIDIQKCKHIIETIFEEYSTYFSLLEYYLNCDYHYWDDLKYLSKVLNINQYKLYTFGVILDNMNLTSSISQVFIDGKDSNSRYLVKSFEFDFKVDLKPLLYQTVYKQNGSALYETINILGSVGFYNVKNIKQNYNISFSSKVSSKNYNFRTLTASFLLRNIVESNISFDQSLEMLCKTPILQSVYFLTFKYDQKYSFLIQRENRSYQIIKKETVIVTDMDEQTLTPNINFSVSRFNDLEKMKDIPVRKFIQKFLSFPIIRSSTQFFLLETLNENVVKII